VISKEELMLILHCRIKIPDKRTLPALKRVEDDIQLFIQKEQGRRVNRIDVVNPDRSIRISLIYTFSDRNKLRYAKRKVENKLEAIRNLMLTTMTYTER
jgi:hypothetical protein